MSHEEFQQFVQNSGKEILSFCRMTCCDRELGDELYQDTMLKLLEKRKQLNFQQNVKSYALSTAILLWKNKKKKYANRKRLIFMDSIDSMETEGKVDFCNNTMELPEDYILQQEKKKIIQKMVANLPEKYSVVIQLYYSADMSIPEIGNVLQIPEGTVKSRMNKAKCLLKKELEVLGYDR